MTRLHFFTRANYFEEPTLRVWARRLIVNRVCRYICILQLRVQVNFFFEMLSFKRQLLSLVLSSSTDAYYEVLTLKIRKEQYVRKTREGSWRNSSVGSMRQSNWTYQSCNQIVRVVVRGRGEGRGRGRKMGRLMKMYAQKFSSEKDIDVISFGISLVLS